MTGKIPPTMPRFGPRRAPTMDEQRWLQCAARMAAAGKRAAKPLQGTAAGREVLGRGAGGDRTLEVDRACESAMREILEREAPFPHLLVSEEAGIVGSPDARWRVVVDPLDGSLNAKRGLEPFGASIAVADGGGLGDILVGYVEDYTRPRAFAAIKGAGVLRAGGPGGVFSDVQRFESGLVEMVLFEAGRPDRYGFRYQDLASMGAVGRSRDMRIRQIGSLALSLCYVAIGTADMLVAAVQARSVDVAAGLLILAEAGGGAATLSGQEVWTQPLDLEKREAFIAWRAGLDPTEVISRWRELSGSLLAGS